MENLVKIENNQMVLDSREVAEMVGMRHADLMRNIDHYIEVISTNAKLRSLDFFVESTYKDKKGETRKRYDITKQGCEMVANKLTGKKGIEFTAKYVTVFNAMKKQLIESRTDSYMIEDPVARAKKWIEEETERQELRKANKEMLPKAEFYDTVANTESLLSMGDTAKILDMGIGRNKLFKFLRSKQILDSYNRPYQRFVDAGYFKLSENKYMAGDNCVVSTTTYVKQKGVDYIRKLLKKDGVA